MKNLDKMKVFRECGFIIEHMQPLISFNGYDDVMDYCYTAGRMDVNRIHVTQPESTSKKLLDTWELVKKVKDLETANARLFERNHELQVDNEESLKEVENQYKIVAALRDDKAQLLERFDEHVEMITELRQENLEYSKRCDELRKVVPTHAKAFIEQSKLVEELKKDNAKLLELLTIESFRVEGLRKHNTELARAALKQDIESVLKSKFVITVEEF